MKSKKWRSQKNIPAETIERWLRDSDWRVRAAAMNACQGRTDIPAETIERGLRDSDCDVRAAAMNACQGRTDIPVETIERWLRDSDCDVREAALHACQGRTDIPVETIERGLRDSDCDVRAAAMKIAEERGIPYKPYRSIEPPEKVYKKCKAGVIVVAHIPDDAEVRGSLSGKCRANKAEILEIIGDFCGEPVGISKHDGTTWYYPGDVVEVEDFDLSDEECSTGYHFFCTIEQARNY